MIKKQEFFTPDLSGKRLKKVVAYIKKEMRWSKSKTIDFIVYRGIQALESEWKTAKTIEKPSNTENKPTVKERWTPDLSDEYGE